MPSNEALILAGQELQNEIGKLKPTDRDRDGGAGAAGEHVEIE